MYLFFSVYTVLIRLIIAEETLKKIDYENPIVETKNGKVLGRNFVTEDENQFQYLGFQGIPYAEPPVGENRFQPPLPRRNWSGVLDTNSTAPACMQPITGRQEFPISEDCLLLNVYSPNVNGSYPVMVYIFGGAFLVGNGAKFQYGPDYLIQEKVVIVVPNYRVGIFGFLSTEDDVAPGNYGLKDQILALQWVKENIVSFGGNPTNVVVFGESAGSASVSLLLQAKSAVGLYHGAIMQSGVSLSLFSRTRNPKDVAYSSAKLLGISANNSNDLLAQLRLIDARSLLLSSVANSIQTMVLSNPRDGLVFSPSIEPVHEGAIFSKNVHEELVEGNFNKVPLIVGFNSAEGNPFEIVSAEIPSFLAKYDLFSQMLIPIDMNVNDSSSSEAASKIKSYYFGNDSVSSQPEALSRFITDDQFIRPTNEFVRLVSRFTPTYFYEFSYVGEVSNAIRTLPGVSHGEDVTYFWKTVAQTGKGDDSTRTKLVKLWTNFAKYRNPTPEVDSELDEVIWEPSNPTDFRYLQIGSNLTMGQNPHKNHNEFWSLIYETYGNPPYDTY